jgi:hypothetical protein
MTNPLSVAEDFSFFETKRIAEYVANCHGQPLVIQLSSIAHCMIAPRFHKEDMEKPSGDGQESPVSCRCVCFLDIQN